MKPVNQQQIKDINMKRLYASIYSTPGISRAELAKRTKLSKTTVSTLVDELIERANQIIARLSVKTVSKKSYFESGG